MIYLYTVSSTLRHKLGQHKCVFSPEHIPFLYTSADIVWAQRVLVAVVMTKGWDYFKLGIDLSKAFDTIKRKQVLDALLQAGCNEDDVRLV